MKKILIVTGSSGEIGSAICKKLIKNKYFVIGIDIKKTKDSSEFFQNIKIDLEKFSNNHKYFQKKKKELKKIIEDKKIIGLINTAAFQNFKNFSNLNFYDLQKSFDINFFSVFKLFKIVEKKLTISRGFFINISSIHSCMTKKNFTAYSTSKSALTSLTKSLSIEIGSKVTCVCVEPGAVNTRMLHSTLQSKKSFVKLKKNIPVKKIALPMDIAKLVYFIVDSKINYMNGSVIDISGGVKNILI